MRKLHKAALLLFLSLLLLTGCGRSGLPFLDAPARGKIEKALLKSLRVEQSAQEPTEYSISFENPGRLALHDLRLLDAGSGGTLASLPRILPGERAELFVHVQNGEAAAAGEKAELTLSYTVGDYRYQTAPLSVRVEPLSTEDFRLYVATERGAVLLSGKPFVFEPGNGVSGLSSARIDSMTVNLSSSFRDQYRVTVDCAGQGPTGEKRAELGYKLCDKKTGVVLAADTLYFGDKDLATCYFSTMADLGPGEYILSFEEHSS